MDERRVLILAPSRRDGEVTAQLLADAGLASRVCQTAAELAEQMEAGAAAIVLTDAALRVPDFDGVRAALARQPEWSDLPVVLLCQIGAPPGMLAQAIASLTAHPTATTPKYPNANASNPRFCWL